MNRDDILEKVFLGHGTVGNDNPIAPTVKFAVDPQPRHAYDPAKSKELLKKAGLDDAGLRSLGRRCRLRRRRRLGDPVEGACQGLRHRHQRHQGTG